MRLFLPSTLPAGLRSRVLALRCREGGGGRAAGESEEEAGQHLAIRSEYYFEGAGLGCGEDSGRMRRFSMFQGRHLSWVPMNLKRLHITSKYYIPLDLSIPPFPVHIQHIQLSPHPV